MALHSMKMKRLRNYVTTALFAGVFCTIALATTPSEKRMVSWSSLLNEFLSQRTATKYSAHDQFLKAYQDLDPVFKNLNLKEIASSKAENIRKFLKRKEELVLRIANTAQRLRQKYNNLNVTEEEVWFYKSRIPEENNKNTTQSNSQSKITPIHYHNSKCKCGYQVLDAQPDNVEENVQCFEPKQGFKASQHFNNIPVSFEETSVHITTEVYNGGADVLRDIYLSDKLFDTFYHELCNESNIDSLTTKWLYFASKNGAMRYYPGKPRVTDDCLMPDLFDSRVTPWYLQSASSPKDVVMLVDSSGSIEGLTLNLIKRSVKHVLDTLTHNDFVNVIFFNQNITYALTKCTKLLQATPANKQFLVDSLENFQIANKSNFELGFHEAFKSIDDEELTTMKIPHAGCNAVVLLFTDGGAVYPEKAVDTWNWDKNHPKRVFTYAVGKNFYEVESVSDIACRNRGVFYRVPSFGATKEETQKYLLKLNKPMVLLDMKDPKWTLPYSDNFGMGTVMSVSVPIYGRNHWDEEEFVGVLGADVLLSDVRKLLKDEMMGNDYYMLGIDNNGFTFLHPKLIEGVHNNPVSVDILELESNKFSQIRSDMIDRNAMETSLLKQVFYSNKYSYLTEFLCAYEPVKGTTFSVATLTHSSKLSSLDATATLEKLNLQTLSPTDLDATYDNVYAYVYSDPCPKQLLNISHVCKYSEDTSVPIALVYDGGIELKDVEECETKSFDNLLLHAWLSNEIIGNTWLSIATNASLDGVLSMFIASENPSFLRLYVDNEDNLKRVKPALVDPANKAFYQRSVHSATDYGWIFTHVAEDSNAQQPLYYETTTTVYTASTTSEPFEDVTITTDVTNVTKSFFTTTLPPKQPSSDFVIATRALLPYPTNPLLAPAVIGVALNLTFFQETIFQLLSHECDKSKLCSADMQVDCANTDVTSCMLVDDGGFLIFSNQEKHMRLSNKFIGYIDGDLTNNLISNDVYSLLNHTNSQKMCMPDGDNEPSSGLRSFYIPNIIQLLNFGWWLSTSAFMVLSTVVQTLWVITLTAVTGSHGHANPASDKSAIGSIPTETGTKFCLLETKVLQFSSKTFYHDEELPCNEACNRTYSSIRIPDTNLLLIVADLVGECYGECVQAVPFENAPKNVAKDRMCSNETVSKHRKEPYGECFDSQNIKAEDDAYCGSSSILISPILISSLIILTQLL